MENRVVPLSKMDHLIRAKSLAELDRRAEMHDDIVSYLFLAADGDEREFAVHQYTEYAEPDMQNILLLRPSDGYDASALLFRSYFNLGMYDEAKAVLVDHLSSYLSLADFVRVLIRYPIDNQYTMDFLKSWKTIMTEDEKPVFRTLVSDFASLPLDESLRAELDALLI